MKNIKIFILMKDEKKKKKKKKKKKMTQTKNYTFEEVQKHNTKKDAWLVINKKVYDVSKWSWKHPGGNVMLNYAGQDATDAFRAFHPDMSYSKSFFAEIEIGDCKDAPETQVVRDFRNMRESFYAKGLYDPRLFFYVWNF